MVVSWILLLGFAIALATTIFMWLKGQTTELTQQTVDYVEGKLECTEVSINVQHTNCDNLRIKNTGKLTLDHYLVWLLAPEVQKMEHKNNVEPSKQTEAIETFGATLVEVVPILKLSDKLVACSEKKVRLDCTPNQ